MVLCSVDPSLPRCDLVQENRKIDKSEVASIVCLGLAKVFASISHRKSIFVLEYAGSYFSGVLTVFLIVFKPLKSTKPFPTIVTLGVPQESS